MATEFYRPLYDFVGGFVGRERLKQKEQKPIDINKPGVLVHGIENCSPEGALQIVLNDGLKPFNEQKYRLNIYSQCPNWVCLAMVGKDGFKYSTASTYGANEKSLGEHISVVINPEYVKAHADEFKAVEDLFSPRNITGKEYRKAIKKLYPGILRVLTRIVRTYVISGVPLNHSKNAFQLGCHNKLKKLANRVVKYCSILVHPYERCPFLASYHICTGETR
jgi:hypothetical protein